MYSFAMALGNSDDNISSQNKILKYSVQTDIEQILMCEAVILGDTVRLQDFLHSGVSPNFVLGGNYREETCLQKHFIEKGYDLSDCENEFSQFNSWCSPLMLAVLHKRIEALQLLLQYGADVELQDPDMKETVIFKALYICADDYVLDVLLDSKCNIKHKNYVGQSPVMKACAMSRYDPRYFHIIQKLLSRPHDISELDFIGLTLMHYIDEIHEGWLSAMDDDDTKEKEGGKNNHHCHEFLSLIENLGGNLCVNVRDKRGEIPLHKAVNCCCPEAVSWLINKGSDVGVRDQDHMTPLLELSLSADPVDFSQIVAAFLKAGNIYDKTITQENLLFGTTDLATRSENLDVLVENGMDVNDKCVSGDTPLVALASYSHDGTRAGQVMHHLIKLGADPNIVNNNGECAIYLATRVQHMYKVNFLLDQPMLDLSIKTLKSESLWHIATTNRNFSKVILPKLLSLGVPGINARDIFGSTPLHWAVFWQNDDAIQFLLQHGAESSGLNTKGFTPESLSHYFCNGHMSEMFETGKKCFQGGCCTNCQHWLTPCSTIVSLQDDNHDWEEHLREFHSMDISKFADMILNSANMGLFYDTDENELVVSELFQTVKSCIEGIVLDDILFKNTAEIQGSMAEGTKCAFPDEIDIVLYLSNFGKDFIPEFHEDIPTGYALLRLADKADAKLYDQFLNNGYLDTYLVTEYLYCLIERRLLICLSKPNPHIALGKSISFGKLSLTSFSLFWNGPLYKSLPISLDIVPTVHFDWLPAKNKTFKSAPMNKIVKDSVGTTIVLKSPSGEEQYTKRTSVFRISMQRYESKMFQSIDSSICKAYMLCKALMNHSPFVSTHKKWKRYYTGYDDYICASDSDIIETFKAIADDPEFPLLITPDPDVDKGGVVSTYMLKIAFMYALDESFSKGDLAPSHKCSTEQILQLSLLTCDILERCVASSSLMHPMIAGLDLLKDQFGTVVFESPVLLCTVQKLKILLKQHMEHKIICYCRS